MTDAPNSEAAARPRLHMMMIDGETFATSNVAGLVQLGVVLYDYEVPEEDWVKAEWVITLQSSLLLGGEVDPKTVAWWGGASQTSPSEEARMAICGNDAVAIPIWKALSQLQAMWAAFGCEEVWSHGSVFDVAILNGYYQRSGQQPPWPHWGVRDTRTRFADAASLVNYARPTRVVDHTGLADAVNQARDVVAAWKALRDFGKPAEEKPSDEP